MVAEGVPLPEEGAVGDVVRSVETLVAAGPVVELVVRDVAAPGVPVSVVDGMDAAADGDGGSDGE